jgi:hypothetical protein
MPMPTIDVLAIGVALATLGFTLPAALGPALAHHHYGGQASSAFCLVLICLAVLLPPAIASVRYAGHGLCARLRRTRAHWRMS